MTRSCKIAVLTPHTWGLFGQIIGKGKLEIGSRPRSLRVANRSLIWLKMVLCVSGVLSRSRSFLSNLYSVEGGLCFYIF